MVAEVVRWRLLDWSMTAWTAEGMLNAIHRPNAPVDNWKYKLWVVSTPLKEEFPFFRPLISIHDPRKDILRAESSCRWELDARIDKLACKKVEVVKNDANGTMDWYPLLHEPLCQYLHTDAKILLCATRYNGVSAGLSGSNRSTVLFWANRSWRIDEPFGSGVSPVESSTRVMSETPRSTSFFCKGAACSCVYQQLFPNRQPPRM